MPRGQAVSHDFPDRRFHQICRPPSRETALDLFDAGDFSPRPDLLHGWGNISKGGKALTPCMQEDQIVVARSAERSLRPNPEDASLEAREPSGSLRFGEIAITALIILHARLGDEPLSGSERPHDIGQGVMGFALKNVT